MAAVELCGMTNSRAKGKASENAVCRYLTAEGWPTKRRLSGNGQAGDLMLADAPHVVIDVKDRAEPRIDAWLDQLLDEADGRPHACLVWKPWSKGPDPARWLALWPGAMDPWTPTMDDPPTGVWGSQALDARCLRNVIGWLTVEADWAPTDSRLRWNSWHIGLFGSFVSAVLPTWHSPEWPPADRIGSEVVL